MLTWRMQGANLRRLNRRCRCAPVVTTVEAISWHESLHLPDFVYAGLNMLWCPYVHISRTCHVRQGSQSFALNHQELPACQWARITVIAAIVEPTYLRVRSKGDPAEIVQTFIAYENSSVVS